MATCWPVCILNQKPLEKKEKDWAFLQRKEHVQIPPKTTTNKEDFITESNVDVDVIRVNKLIFVPCKWLYEPGHVTKNPVNICIELVPHNPPLTYHQHNLCVRCLKWLKQLWSSLKHVPFVHLIIVFSVYVDQIGAKCCSSAISVCPFVVWAGYFTTSYYLVALMEFIVNVIMVFETFFSQLYLIL